MLSHLYQRVSLVIIITLLVIPMSSVQAYPSHQESQDFKISSIRPNAQLLSGGPDAFGYAWDDSEPFNWIDVVGGTSVAFINGGSGAIGLPFSFLFYGNSYTSVYISQYGYISFTAWSNWPWQQNIPSSQDPNNVVAPYWAPMDVPQTGYVKYMTGGVSPERYFVVEWHGMEFNGDKYTFETILNENGDITFQYQSMYNQTTACESIGIENYDGTDGLLYSPYCSYPDLNSAPKNSVRFIYPGSTFNDVNMDYWAWSYIERLANASITGGCGTGIFCPEDSVTRAQMAIFLEKSKVYPSSFGPPNVPPTFTDTVGHWAEDWIEALKNDGITSGCAADLYCPEAPVTRAQMAVFLLRAKYGSSYNPPSVGAGTGFGDVPTGYWAAAWIKQLVAEGITSGCGSGNYCPEAPVSRAQMAVFLVKTFNLP